MFDLEEELATVFELGGVGGFDQDVVLQRCSRPAFDRALCDAVFEYMATMLPINRDQMLALG